MSKLFVQCLKFKVKGSKVIGVNNYSPLRVRGQNNFARLKTGKPDPEPVTVGNQKAKKGMPFMTCAFSTGKFILNYNLKPCDNMNMYLLRRPAILN